LEFLDNNYLLEYKGKTFTEKLRDSIVDNILEVREERLGYTPRLTQSTLVMCYDIREKYPEIKGLGSSAMIKEDGKLTEDLTLNNLMLWLSGWFGSIPSRTRTLTDVDGNSSDINSGSWNNQSNPNVNLGTLLQIGSGSPAFRADFKLVTGFPSGNQANRFDTNLGGWNSAAGRVTVNGSVVTSVILGVVNEVGLFGVWREIITSDVTIYMLTHDIIIPNVAFDVGESIQVTCTWVF